MGWNSLSIPKLQRCNRWSFGMDKEFHSTLYWTYDCLCILGLQLNHDPCPFVLMVPLSSSQRMSLHVGALVKQTQTLLFTCRVCRNKQRQNRLSLLLAHTKQRLNSLISTLRTIMQLFNKLSYPGLTIPVSYLSVIVTYLTIGYS